MLSVYQKSDKPLVIWAYFSIVHEMNQIPVSTLLYGKAITCHLYSFIVSIQTLVKLVL